MDAMSKMMASMIGLKPEELKKLFENMQGLVLSTAEKVSQIHEAVTRMEDKADLILTKLEDANGGNKPSNRRGGNRAGGNGDSGNSAAK